MSFLNRFRKNSTVSSSATSSDRQNANPPPVSTVGVPSSSTNIDECAECRALKRRLEEMTVAAGRHERSYENEAVAVEFVEDHGTDAWQSKAKALEQEASELRATTQQLMDDLAVRDRAIKRVESSSKETLRAKEKQIVQQGLQLAELQTDVVALHKKMSLLQEQLDQERRRVATFEVKANDGEQDSLQLVTQTQWMLEQKTAVISELQESLKRLTVQDEENQRKLAAAENRVIVLAGEVGSKDAVIASLRESVESEKRVAMLQRAAVKGNIAASLPVATVHHPAVLNRSQSSEVVGDDVESPHGSSVATSQSLRAEASEADNVSTPELQQTVREALKLEQMLRAKDKQIVSLSGDVVRLRTEVSSKNLQIEKAVADNEALKATVSSLRSSLDDTRSSLEKALSEVNRRAVQVAELRSEKEAREAERISSTEAHRKMERELHELRAEEDAHRSFRAQHADCQAQKVEKDLKLFQSATALSEAKSVLERVLGENEHLTSQLVELRKQQENSKSDSDVRVQMFDARVSSLEVDLAEKKRCVHELEDLLREKSDAHSAVSKEMAALRALREDERESYRQKTLQSQDALHQLQQSLQKAQDGHEKRERQLILQVEKLQQDNNTILQAKREQEAHVLHLSELLKREQQQRVADVVSGTSDANLAQGRSRGDDGNAPPSAGGSSSVLKPRSSSGLEDVTPQSAPAQRPINTTSLQRISLELEEMRQKYTKLQRDTAGKDMEIENLIRRLREAEGGVLEGDGTQSSTSSRRILGIVESFSVEIAAQIAAHLKHDFMRNGCVQTLNGLISAFHLDAQEGRELVDVLSRIMICVRCGVPLPIIARKLSMKEISLRRVATAFSKAVGGCQAGEPSARRQRLIEGTPPHARYNYSGSERLSFLLCATSGKANTVSDDDDEKDDDAPPSDSVAVRRLGRDPYVLALVCSYLPVVLRGTTAFAAHVLSNKTSNPTGHTMLISLDPPTSTFSMMECEVTAARCIVVLISGAYKSGFSWQTCAHVKVSLACRSKQDGIFLKREETKSSKWKWSEECKIPKEEASLIQYTIRHDSVGDGLVAETQGVTLRELAIEEVMQIQELYSGQLNSDEMLRHTSWDSIPPPLPTKKDSSGRSANRN